MSLFKIVADSSSDVKNLKVIPYSVAPLKILTDESEYIDDNKIDVNKMVKDLLKYKGKSSTSCPNPEDWLKAFGNAKYIFCVTITDKLSGSYNSALIAKEAYEKKYKDRRVFIVNSLSTGPEMKLIIDKLSELILKNYDFDFIVKEITQYLKKTSLIFMLESMKNLANNGRVSKVTAKAAGLLGIRVIGKASFEGTLEVLDKIRGEEKAIKAVFERMKEKGFNGGKVNISHCFNKYAAETLKNIILREFKNTRIEIYQSGGLCSFYAEKGGMLVGFEGN